MDEFDDPSPTMDAVRSVVNDAVRLRRTLSRHTGLSETELEALEHLVVQPSTPGELARLLDISTAASTGVVDRLERRAHVERRKHPTDRRRQEVHVTDSGRAELLELLRPGLDGLRAVDAGLTPAERDTVVRYLDGVRATFEQITVPLRNR